MNWTGGRLRRHSHNRPGSLSRIQKRHFAKARLWCPNSFNQFSQFQYPSYHSTARTAFEQPVGGLKPPLVSPYDNDDGIEESICQPCQHCSDAEDLSQHLLSATPGDSQRKRKRQLSGSRETYCQTPQCPLGASELDFLKCQLLQKSDWTAVALSRPLTMAFTPTEDREKVGRRRRITKDDKKRQSAPALKIFSTEYSPQSKNIQPEHKDSRDIKIKIGGKRYGGDLASQSQKRAQSQESPESMLLDYEGSLIRTSMKAETDTKQKDNRQSDEHTTGMANYGCVKSVSLGLRQLPDKSNFSLQDTLSSRYFSTESSLGSPRLSEFGGLTSGSPVLPSRVYRRFTLDEQAEHERKLDLGEQSRDACKRESEDSYTGPSPSPRFRKGGNYSSSSFLQKSPPANRIAPHNVLSLSSNQNYSRLPTDQTFLSRSSRHIGDLETAAQPFIVHSGAVSSSGQELSEVRVRREHSIINELAEQSRPPIFFGQPVKPFSEAETDKSCSKAYQHLIQQCNNPHQHINEPTYTNGRNRVWTGFRMTKPHKFKGKAGGHSSSVTTESDAICISVDASRNLLHPTDYASHSDTDFFSQTSPSEDHSLIQYFPRNSSPPNYYQSPKFTVRPSTEAKIKARFPPGQPNISQYNILRIY